MIEWTHEAGDCPYDDCDKSTDCAGFPTPKDRAAHLGGVFQETTWGEGSDLDAVTDLLADIRHFCDVRGFDFAALDRRAYTSYSRERADHTTRIKALSR